MPIKIKRNLKEKSTLGKIVFRTAIGLSAYTLALIGLEYYSDSKSEPIRSQEHLEQIMEEEIKKLGIENKNILLILDDNEKWNYPYAVKIGEESYEININPSKHKVVSVKHELYHIADGHCDFGAKFSSDSNIDHLIFYTCYFFYYEPQAAIYAATGLKL